MSKHEYHVYILRCADHTFYTGYTSDVERRVHTHNQGKGARYTRSRLPVELVYSELCASKSAALQREYEIKQWSRYQKEALINGLLLESDQRYI